MEDAIEGTRTECPWGHWTAVGFQLSVNSVVGASTALRVTLRLPGPEAPLPVLGVRESYLDIL